MKRLDSWLRVLGYAVLLLAFLWLAMGVKAQYEVNREARLQKWSLISMELADVNLATSDWNTAVGRYKTLDDIQTWELLLAIRKAQVANAKIEAYLMTLDEPLGTNKEFAVKEFRCTCGVLVITNDVTRTKCTTCEAKAEADAPLDDYPPDRFGDF